MAYSQLFRYSSRVDSFPNITMQLIPQSLLGSSDQPVNCYFGSVWREKADGQCYS